jgi:hypothetical protein
MRDRTLAMLVALAATVTQCSSPKNAAQGTATIDSSDERARIEARARAQCEIACELENLTLRLPVASIDVARLVMIIPTSATATLGMDLPTYSLWKDPSSGAVFVAQQGGYSGSWTWFGPTTREDVAVQQALALQQQSRTR